MPALDMDVLLDELRLVGPANSAQLIAAITEPPMVERTVDGASTLTVTVTDWGRVLLSSGTLSAQSYAVVDGVPYTLVGVRKFGDRVTLTFEDSIVAALRRQTSPLSIPAGSQSWAQIVQRLASEAAVPVLVDPADRGVVNRVVERATGTGGASDSWRILADGSSDRGLRCFSDGRRLIVGSDDWLATLVSPWRPVEHVGPVGHIDFDLDVGREQNSGTVYVTARRQAVPPGRAIELAAGLGPASGRWLASRFVRTLTSQAATVEITRPRQPLPEPPPETIETEIGPGVNSEPVDLALALSGIRTTAPAPAPRAPTGGGGPSPRAADRAAGVGVWAWPTYDKRVTSPFGPRKSPTKGASSDHKGVDLAGKTGVPVFAARAGKVIVAERQSGYGLVVFLDHGSGITSRYAHMSQIMVSVGQQVTIGTQVGKVGATGNVTGSHLHFEIRVGGLAKNPLNYLP